MFYIDILLECLNYVTGTFDDHACLSGILFYLVHNEIYMTLKQTDAPFIYSSQFIWLNIAVLVKE